MSRLAVLIFIFSLGLTESFAQDDGQGQLQKCASIPDEAARLACFDIYAARASKADTTTSDGTLRQAKQADQSEEEQRQIEFGLTETEIARREAQEKQQETQTGDTKSMPAKTERPVPKSVVARVEIFARLKRSNNIRITLDNGQIWQEIDGAPFRGSVVVGAEVTITERRFSGYKMKVPGRSSPILVRRIK